jgi:ribulose-5-phosphate 4-epimerase/fuculose-1-phosphate aldolase
MHTQIYRARPDVNAVIHAHAPYATILGLSGLPFLPVTAEAALLGEVPVVPFHMPGTMELAQAVVQALGQATACILNHHGVVAVAANLRQAANAVEILERSAQLILGCYAAGKQPAILPEEALRALRERGLA